MRLVQKGITKDDTLLQAGGDSPPPFKTTTINHERTMQMDEIKMTIANRPVMLTIREASEYVIGLSEYQIRSMCKSGKLPYIMAGKKYLINRDVLLKYLGIELNYEW